MTLTRRTFLTTTAALPLLTLGNQTFAQSTTGSVGVLIPGSISDRGFNEAAYTGYKALNAKYTGLQLIENLRGADIEQALMQLAAKHDLIVAVSGESQKAMLTVAKRFPGKKFLLIAGTRLVAGEKNVAQYDVRQAENAFLVGAAAAMLSKTGVLSIVAGMELPGIVNSAKEFTNGAKHVRPDSSVITTFVGSWDDVSKAKEATLAVAGRGADIHFPVLRSALIGTEQASRDTRTHMFGVWTARCGSDPTYCAYSVIGIGHLLQHGVEQYMAGKYQAGSQAFGFKAGPEASDIAICSGLTPQITATMDRIKKDIISGKITTLEG